MAFNQKEVQNPVDAFPVEVTVTESPLNAMLCCFSGDIAAVLDFSYFVSSGP